MRYPLLDPLRGLAALWVASHHLVFSTGQPVGPYWWPACVGYFGVTLFFVISGYCLTAAARRSARHAESVPRFLLRRGVRIYPPFWGSVAVAVAVYAGLALSGLSPVTPYEGYIRSAWRGLDPAGWGGLLTLGAVFRPGGELPWQKFGAVNLAYWSLAVEVQFYAVVGLALLAPRWFYPALAAVTVGSLPFLFDEAAYRSGWFVPHWPFFALGVGLYAALERGWTAARLPRAGRLAVVAAGVGLVADGLARGPLVPEGGMREVIRGTFGFAVGLTLLLWVRWRPAGPEVAPRGPAAAAADRLGAMSYTLYLLHIPLIVAVGAVLGRLVPLGTPVSFALTLVAVCLLCYPFHRWVERPCVGWRGGAAEAHRPSRTGGTGVDVDTPPPRDPGRRAVRTPAGAGIGRG
jgi:peptidoglycan/LPS O-acetylase OafA/YrhL